MEETSLSFFKRTRTCAIVPTYNNAGTLPAVLERLRPFIEDIIVVNDGSTDETESLLDKSPVQVDVVTLPENQGKGMALRLGFERAMRRGFAYAVTLDADGQHYPEELPHFAEALAEHPQSLIVGSRKLKQENMPGKNTFANYFSNFWFALQTWQYLPDTQTGFRLYPLLRLRGLHLLTNRYEAELELLVLSAWQGIPLVPISIDVYYPPREERVSHFRPFWDFLRITLLNCVLCLLCLLYGWWKLLWYRLRLGHFRRRALSVLYLTVALLLALLYPLPVVGLLYLTGKETEHDKMNYHRLLCRYFRFLLYRIPRVDVEIDNPNRETFMKPSILICNHESHIDLLSVLSLSPRIVALTNQWVWNFPIYKPVLRYLEYYPATEGLENSLDHISSLVERGYSVVIFPEGTRSADCKVHKFRRGAFYLAEKLGCDIVPIYLEGPGKIMPKHQVILNPGQIRIHIGKRVAYNDDSMGANYREKTRNWHKYYLDQEKFY